MSTEPCLEQAGAGKAQPDAERGKEASELGPSLAELRPLWGGRRQQPPDSMRPRKDGARLQQAPGRAGPTL